ncbi:hypothetical protein J2T58_000630 [Methanocalculus alkaliphilus]|uniref:potassium channel family protein n=1 Tax=Methanocalculus alkaliphilus TaxID=768730 RepID=UPI00209CACA5|nr:potassium channel family protein [Methanocalculus alkaliphilus]MCP1714785.1 hypothetical protein [Methanocalculus alkaliphilus]
MSAGDTRFRLYLLVFLSVFIIGSIGLVTFEGLSLFDAIYFIIVTIATVGYGDIVPVTDEGRLLSLILIIAGVGTFVTVVAYSIDIALSRSSLRAREKKVRMIIGVFFSEVGFALIELCKAGIPEIRAGINDLMVNDQWDAKRFAQARKNISSLKLQTDICSVNRVALHQFLKEKRTFLIMLLQHPMLFEHDPFSDMILAISHLEEELSARRDLNHLSPSDCAHLSRDCDRVFHLLLLRWLEHMEYLKLYYPFLFSLAVRTNPFNPEADPEVRN